MAPFAFPHKSDDGVDEVMELQNTAHYSPSIANLQPISILESINSVLHATKSTDANNNGSQTGSAHGHSPLNTPTGQGESEEESDLAVLLALFIPLAATVTAIFIIALFVRKMRRAESMHEVHRTNNLNEFPMTSRKKTNTSANSSVSSASSTTVAHSSSSPTSLAHHGKGSSSSSSSISNINGSSHQPLDKSSSSASIYCNSSYLRFAGHRPLNHQTSLPITEVSQSPLGRVPPAWPGGSIYYTRSQYGLNKLNQQLIQQASLQAFSSMQSLNGINLNRHYTDPTGFCTHSDPEIEGSSDESSHNSSTESSNDAKKSGNKKFKRVLSAINFPRKIRQYQADRKRFNIYTIPMETREQLKHIYVY